MIFGQIINDGDAFNVSNFVRLLRAGLANALLELLN